jgi:hypothetical protein
LIWELNHGLDPVIVSNIDIVVDSEVICVDRSISDHNATMINIKIPYSIKSRRISY